MKRRFACVLTATLMGVATLGSIPYGTASAETITAVPGGGWINDPRFDAPDAVTVLGPGAALNPPREGSGSLELRTTGPNQAPTVTNPLLNELFPETLTIFHPFAGLTGSWATYILAGTDAAVAAQFKFEAYDRVVTANTGPFGDFMTVVLSPNLQSFSTNAPGLVIPGQWQPWTINNSTIVWQTDDGDPCDETDNCTLAQFNAAYQSATFYDVQLSAGSVGGTPGFPAFVSYVDSVHLSSNGVELLNTNFDPPPVPPTPVVPVTTADEYATPLNTPLVVGAASGVLLNDSAQGHPMTAALVAAPVSGQVQLAADGSFTYTPNAGFVGVDTFTYTARDTTPPGATSPATTVTITVTDPTAPPPALPANRSQFVPVAPTRIVDTRIGLGAASGPVAAGSNTVVTAVGKAGIPAGATGVVVNITAAEGAAGGYLQAFPTGAPVAGATSNVNIDHSNSTVADLALVGLDATGRFTIFSFRPTQLVVDVFGYFVPAATAGAGRLVPQDPVRVLDTRSGVGATGPVAAGGSVVLNLANRVPPDAGAVVMTLTATRSQAPGWVQAIPTGGATALGASSNVNIDRAGDSTANTVIVPVGAGGNVTLFSSIGTDLVADVVGYFTGASAAAATTGLFVPVVPERLADSRVTGTVVAGNTTITVPVAGRPNLPDPPPTAIAGTLTATETSGGGFGQVFPTGGTTAAGSTSTLNWNGPGRTQAVATIVGAPRGSVSLFTSDATHLIYDITGYFI